MLRQVARENSRLAAAVERFHMLNNAGYCNCVAVTDPTLAAAEFEKSAPDLVLLDLRMQPISGLDVLHSMNRRFRQRGDLRC